MIFVGITPVRFRLRFNAGNAVKDDNRAVQDAKRALHLHREINMPWCVYQINAVFKIFIAAVVSRRPKAGCRGGGNRNPPLPLLLHPVHYRVAGMHLADFMRNASIEKHPLGNGGLAGINMGNDTYISHLLNRILSWHKV